MTNERAKVFTNEQIEEMEEERPKRAQPSSGRLNTLLLLALFLREYSLTIIIGCMKHIYGVVIACYS